VEDDEEDDKPVATPARDTSRVKKAEVKDQKRSGTTLRHDQGSSRARSPPSKRKLKTAKVESKDDDEDDDAPAVKPARVKQAAVETKKVEAKPVAEAPKPQTKVAKVEPQQKVAKVEPESKKIDKTPTASLPAATESKPAVSDAANPEFRWPARGRIIQGFKSGGNDGINIAVPEGTSVKAAEGGTVAYAGSELKGYGNLVLIRHPNGFVSAYAHNGDIEVKRGDTVKRGQTIAKSGQSGNVASPQLHFELRKGSTPVDPTGYLAGL
jgi:murein DD-endopeptidase MepM/ murein hydrolase activator NlpD